MEKVVPRRSNFENFRIDIRNLRKKLTQNALLTKFKFHGHSLRKMDVSFPDEVEALSTLRQSLQNLILLLE